MSATRNGRVDYSFTYYPSLAGNDSTRQSYNLTPNVQSWTHTTSMFGPQTLIVKLVQKLDWLTPDSRGFIIGHVGSKEQPLILALTKVNQTWNAVTATPDIILEFKSIAEQYGTPFSKSFPGGLIEIVQSAYDITYADLNLTPYAPRYDSTIDKSVFGEQLWQYQTISEYIKETRGYAVAPDKSPVFIWHDMNRVRFHSGASLLAQPPVNLMVTTTEAAGQNVSKIVKGSDGIVGAYCIDYREEVAADIKKINDQYATRYIVPRTGGEQFMYTRLSAPEQAPNQVKVLYQPQRILDQTKDGIAVVLADIWKTALSTARASVLMYNDSAFLRPGALVNIILADYQKQYLVVMNATEGSSIDGFQTIYLLDVSEINKFMKESDNSQTENLALKLI